MSEGGEPKQNTQNYLTFEGGEPKQNTQNHLTSPMCEGGEPKQNTQNHLRHICLREENRPPSDIGDFTWFWVFCLGPPP
jgi:hypothetical protein